MTGTIAPEIGAVTTAKPALVTTTTPHRFTAMDRCDTCQAQAYIGATVNGTELTFCAHHGRKYEEKLRLSATKWHDETARLSVEGAERQKE